MKNRKSIYFIVAFSVFVGLLHILIGPDYQGFMKGFVRGYLIDILLPCNLYLLLQILLRKRISVFYSRMAGAIMTFSFAVFVEVLQWNNIRFLGETYDTCDIFMYATGVGLGLVLDVVVINRLEKIKNTV